MWAVILSARENAVTGWACGCGVGGCEDESASKGLT